MPSKLLDSIYEDTVSKKYHCKSCKYISPSPRSIQNLKFKIILYIFQSRFTIFFFFNFNLKIYIYLYRTILQGIKLCRNATLCSVYVTLFIYVHMYIVWYTYIYYLDLCILNVHVIYLYYTIYIIQRFDKYSDEKSFTW